MKVLGISYDIFRNGALGLASVAENPRWIAGLLRPAVRPAFDGCRTVFAKEDGGTVDIGALAKSLSLPASPETWAQLVSNPSLDAEVERHIVRDFEGITHVIGFGLPPTLMRLLDRAGIYFVDLEIAQIRLSSKIRFRARTNSKAFKVTLESLSYPVAEHIAEAQRALSKRSHQERPNGLRRGVFLGQTQLDLALVENGRMRFLHEEDLLNQIQQLVEDLDEVHILPHPVSASRLGHLLPLISLAERMVLGASGTYSMLCHSETVRAISLSSGALVEANLLGVEAHNLILPDRDNPRYLPEGLSGWIEVDDALFAPETMMLFANGNNEELVTHRGAELVDAALGAGRNILANTETIREIPNFKTGMVYTLNSNMNAAPLGCLQFGWSSPEPWGVWSTGQVAALAFRLSTEDMCRLTIRGIYFQHQTAEYNFIPELNVKMSIDGKLVPLMLESVGNEWSVSVELPASLVEVPIFLHFLIDGACSPRTFAINSDSRKLGIGLVQIEIARPEELRSITTQTQDANYYKAAHTDLEGYRENNWMMPYAKPLLSLNLETIIECACGNGEFSEMFARHVKTYWALDWAASPLLPHSTPGFRHLRWDAYSDQLPKGDLLFSADFLEHIREVDLDSVLSRMLMAAKRQFHVIACFDDFHSHLTIERPEWWLARLQRVSEFNGDTTADWQIMNWSHRDAERPVAIVCNFTSELSSVT